MGAEFLDFAFDGFVQCRERERVEFRVDGAGSVAAAWEVELAEEVIEAELVPPSGIVHAPQGICLTQCHGGPVFDDMLQHMVADEVIEALILEIEGPDQDRLLWAAVAPVSN